MPARRPASDLPQAAAFYGSAPVSADESIGYLMKRALGSIVAQADRRLAAIGLTNAQWAPLLHLSKSGPCPVADLARQMVLDAGATTRLLDRLEKKGLCQRVRSTTDRRVVQVQITPSGRAAIGDVPAVLAEVMNQHLAGFTHAEWDTLKTALRRIVANGDAVKAPE
jgi:DNA-binding MarR family transcriptional regulator